MVRHTIKVIAFAIDEETSKTYEKKYVFSLRSPSESVTTKRENTLREQLVTFLMENGEDVLTQLILDILKEEEE